jgi:acetyltransferase-like isoleucine patch superfamily enzyme
MTPDPPLEPLAADFAAWDFWGLASDEQAADQRRRLADLRERGYAIGVDAVVSRLAAVHPSSLTLGARSSIAAHAHVTGDVVLGDDCTVNVGVAVRGPVTAGRAVRIGAHTSLIGFDHGFDDPDVEIYRQPHSSVGVMIGDDVWIGAHVVVLDGVRIGSHAVVGAGSVVTRDVPEWAIVVGNPARVVRSRRSPRPRTTREALAAHGDAARAQVAGILAGAWVDGTYRDSAGATPTIRAHTDAVELADLLTGAPPPQLSRDEHVARLRALQDPRTGLVPEPAVAADRITPLLDDGAAYHVLDVGYALDLLGSSFPHPVRTVTELSPAALADTLDGLPWTTKAWGSGALVDALGTALTLSAKAGHTGAGRLAEALVGWLVAHRDPATGLWGSDARGLLQPVNGAYRLVRGTLAQWGLGIGGERELVDTVLARGAEVLADPAASACDALDVVWLLWWARATGGTRQHRAPEVAEVAAAVLDDALARWVPGEGTPFAPGRASSLQGTEMWLTTAWHAADLLNCADALGYRPRGVHRTEPALRLAARSTTKED